MTFSNKFINKSPFRKEEEPKNEDNLEYTTKSESGISDTDYAKYFGEGSIHRPNLDQVDLGVVKANKKIGESSIVDTSKGSSFPTGASTETIKQWYANNPSQSGNITAASEDAFKDDSFFKQAATLVSNPVQGIKALGNQMSYNYVTDEFGNYSRDPALNSLTDLRRAKESGRSIQGDALNTAGQIGMLGAGVLGAMSKAGAAANTAQTTKIAKALSSLKNPLTTQTYLDAASGDFTGLGLKFLPKAIRGKLKKPIKSLYYGYKGSKIGG